MTTTACPHCGTATDGAQICPACGMAAAKPQPTMLPPTPVLDQHRVTVPPGNDGLRHALLFAGMASWLRRVGIGSIIWGIFFLGLSIGGICTMGTFDSFSEWPVLGSTIGYLATIFGCLLGLGSVAVGVWLMFRVTSASLLVAAFALFCTAFSMLFGAATGIITQSVLEALVLLLLPIPILPFSLAMYGVRLFRWHLGCESVLVTCPRPELLQQAKELLNTLRRSSCRRSPEVIEFQTSATSLSTTDTVWRGVRQTEGIVLVAYESGAGIFQDACILPLLGLTIETHGKEVLSRWWKATICLGDRKLTGLIPQKYFARYEAWQQERLQVAERTTNATHGGAESEYPERDVPV